ncbi:MAG: ABC transporter substrate-binding protein [Clostridiales bacterium]|nr:ABC transporter substrate-binding protein [Clostridiales bacterium]
MKKLISILCAAATSCALVLSLSACGDGDTGKGSTGGEQSNVKGTVHVYMPDGAPAIALAALMDSGYNGFDFTVVPSTEIAGAVSSRTADMAIMPIDAAATLYNNGADIVMLSVNTHGNLYMVGNQEDVALADLKGKKLGVIGQGSVPDNVLRMLLKDAQIDGQISESAVSGKVALTYNDATALIPLFKQGKLDYILLGEPAVTNAVNATGGKIAMDMQAQWAAAFDGQFPQACLVAKGSLVKDRKSDVDQFLAAVKNSDGWAELNPDKALQAVSDNMKKGNQTTLKALNASIVRRCNVSAVSASDSREQCNAYFEKLHGLTAYGLGTPVLAKVPDDNFYYKA